MIKAIIFDYGNVISAVHNDLFIERISRFSERSIPELRQMIYNDTDLPALYETGMISSDEFFSRAVRLGGLNISKEEFIESFTGIFTPLNTTRGMIRDLKSGYKLGLLSNTNEWHFEHEIKRCDVYNLFDAVTLSFRVGAMKPDRKIYLDALGKLNMKPEECVYIDDIKEYSDAASAMGIRGIHYTSHEGLIESLTSLKVLPATRR